LAETGGRRAARGSAPPPRAGYILGSPRHGMPFKLSVGETNPSYLLEIEGLFTRGSRPGRTVGESVGGILEMDSSDWSNGIRYHTFGTRPDTGFKKCGLNVCVGDVTGNIWRSPPVSARRPPMTCCGRGPRTRVIDNMRSSRDRSMPSELTFRVNAHSSTEAQRGGGDSTLVECLFSLRV